MVYALLQMIFVERFAREMQRGSGLRAQGGTPRRDRSRRRGPPWERPQSPARLRSRRVCTRLAMAASRGPCPG